MVVVGWRASWWLTLSILLLGVCLRSVSPVAANSYHDFLCRVPYGPSAGRAAPADDVFYATGGAFVYAGDGCEGGGALYAAMDGTVTHPYGAGATDTFGAPAGLMIAGFTVWRYEADGPSRPYGSPASNLLYSPGPPSVQGLCAEPDACASRGTPSDPLDPANAVTVSGLGGVTQIQWSAACGGGPGGTCPASGPEGSGVLSSQYDVYAADIDLVDDTPPSVSAISGPLVAGGALSGEQSVSFDASDGQSGVYGGSLLVDGRTAVSQVLDSNGGACQSLSVTTDGQRSFEHAQPCKSSLSSSLTLNTSQLMAGAHSLELVVEDAAGNQTIAYEGTITVVGAASSLTGTAAIGPCSPTVLHGRANGVSASGQVKLSARWVSTAKALRISRYGKSERITGRLMNSGGVGIASAAIDVCETPAYDGAPARHVGETTTTATGQWSFTLPQAVSSAALRFVYPSPQNDTTPLVMSALTLRVHAGISLRISPRTSSVGRRIYFSGVLHGDPIPPGGKQLVLEASSGGEWIEFRTITTSAKGRYRASYRFKFPGPVSYRFRVLCPHEADFPFLAGASNVVGVYER